MNTVRPVRRWGLLWRQNNRLDGETQHILCNGSPLLFRTRAEARTFAERNYGYVRNRPDLQREPHGWKMPLPVRVKVEVAQ